MSYETEMVPYSLDQTRRIHQLLAQFKVLCYDQNKLNRKDGVKLLLDHELVAGLLDAECYRNANVNQKVVTVKEYYGSAQEISDHHITVCCAIRLKQGELAEWWLPLSPMNKVIPESSRQDDGSIKPVSYFKLQVTEEKDSSITYRFEPFTDTDENLRALFSKDDPFANLGSVSFMDDSAC